MILQVAEDDLRKLINEAVAPLVAELSLWRRQREETGCTLPEAARLLGVSKRTVKRRIQSGEFRATGAGRGLRVFLPQG